jgi:hypothetical protein
VRPVPQQTAGDGELSPRSGGRTRPNDCCVHLLTTIGLEIMYPERAAELRAAARPADVPSVSHAVRR